ncbi:hypothetical protein ACFLZT_07270 [Thermodesulfobacteriota bacterium]
MDTLRVDICYRPLRIGWVIKSGDFDAFRKVIRYSYALWGGRFNPILFVDHENESSQLIDLFGVDVIIPVGVSDEVKDFPKKYPYLIKPFFQDSIFMKGDEHSHPYSNVLDIYNMLAYFRDKPEWKKIKDHGVHCYSWTADDPLADVFLSQLGGYPDKEEVGTDYLEFLKKASEFTEISLDSAKPIPTAMIDHPGISYLSRHGMKRHYGMGHGWKNPGFFVGSVTNLEDLVCHWNLRACNISLLFVDPQYLERYTDLLPAWEKAMQDGVASYRHEWDRKIAVWTRWEDLDEACKSFGDSKLMRCRVSDGTWNGRNVSAPMMYFGETSVLGVMSGENSKPKVSFALSDKPFCDDTWFNQHYLVASVSFIGGLYGDDQHTFHAPYLPELNEFYARTMHFEYDKLRIEPERIGIVINTTDHDSFLYALPVGELMERIFDMAGYEAKLSNAGLITKQLITRLGGVQGGRVFKVPGVRRLLKTHGPNASITKRAALQTIGSKDPDRPDAKFSDHQDLFIESRPFEENLTPDAIFGYLVEKGLFRVGADLNCPSCKMNSWIPLDSLKHKVVCDLCGQEHDVTRNLTDVNEWHYRRSGVLGVEKNAQGAVPVFLTLQQLDTNFHSGLSKNLYSPSLDLTPKTDVEGTKCETDFVWVIPRAYPRKNVVILAECKDKGPITIDDATNLKRIADSLPKKRFKTFIVLSQISPFTDSEIKIAKTLNNQYFRRAILLSANELEPYYIRERAKDESGRDLKWYSPEEMANSTALLYFAPKEMHADKKDVI